jgi:hypothetical protein
VETLNPSTAAAISLSFLLGPLLLAVPHAIRRWLPLLPRRAVRGMRAVSGAPLKDYRPNGVPNGVASNVDNLA